MLSKIITTLTAAATISVVGGLIGGAVLATTGLVVYYLGSARRLPF